MEETVAEHIKKSVLYESDSSNTAILNIEPGDQLSTHYHPNADDIWVVIQGTGEFLAEENKTYPIKAGMIIPNLKGEVHGVCNTGTEPLVIVAVSAPVPVQAVFTEQNTPLNVCRK
ncbi:MAG: cupin domain-containing protein [Peptococcaceae bacterium]|nr:cupin domain-containing protein [Peptococcaceae bacterium]